MTEAVAAAPCNVGIGGDPHGFVSPDQLAEATTGAGYSGIDLGPPGYLDAAPGLENRLVGHGLAVSGAWVTVGAANTDEVLDFLLAACDLSKRLWPDLPPPRPTLAAPEPPTARLGAPVRATGDDWRILIDQVSAAAATCRDRGHDPVFHPHVGTLVETPEDTDRFLDSTDIDLCFDPGHVALGGGTDVVALARRWETRITHLHLKNVRMDIVDELRSTEADPQVTWSSGVFSPLDAGSLDLPAMISVLRAFDGWIVIEQDAAAPDQATANQALDDQRRNLATLREWGW